MSLKRKILSNACKEPKSVRWFRKINIGCSTMPMSLAKIVNNETVAEWNYDGIKHVWVLCGGTSPTYHILNFTNGFEEITESEAMLEML